MSRLRVADRNGSSFDDIGDILFELVSGVVLHRHPYRAMLVTKHYNVHCGKKPKLGMQYGKVAVDIAVLTDDVVASRVRIAEDPSDFDQVFRCSFICLKANANFATHGAITHAHEQD